MGALRRLGNDAPFSLRRAVFDSMGCAGVTAFGDELRTIPVAFAWTSRGWLVYGEGVHEVFVAHGLPVRIVLVSGTIVYSDLDQVVIERDCMEVQYV